MSILYHPGKANVVVDTLNIMTMGSVSHIDEVKKSLVKDVHRLGLRLKDYDMSVYYHPNKANMVADALSRMTMGSVSHIDEAKKYLLKDVNRLARFGVRLEDSQVVDSWYITLIHHW